MATKSSMTAGRILETIQTIYDELSNAEDLLRSYETSRGIDPEIDDLARQARKAAQTVKDLMTQINLRLKGQPRTRLRSLAISRQEFAVLSSGALLTQLVDRKCILLEIAEEQTHCVH
ncbi:MAG: hypothetical protein SGJ21_07310 [Alphaproteobacteria bacterium]|nr:hypothetical protein [Alphaproteobacteria bacterium]